MGKWMVTGLLLAIGVALALSVRRWLPPLLGFVGANSDSIQAMTDLAQWVL